MSLGDRLRRTPPARGAVFAGALVVALAAAAVSEDSTDPMSRLGAAETLIDRALEAYER